MKIKYHAKFDLTTYDRHSLFKHRPAGFWIQRIDISDTPFSIGRFYPKKQGYHWRYLKYRTDMNYVADSSNNLNSGTHFNRLDIYDLVPRKRCKL